MPSGVTWTRSKSVKTGLGSLGGVAEKTTYQVEENIEIDLAAGQTALQVDAVFAVASTHGIAVDFAKTVTVPATSGTPTTLTITSNSPTDDTVVINYGTAFDWLDDFDPSANQPFSGADVTGLYFTNDSPTVPITVKMSILKDVV